MTDKEKEILLIKTETLKTSVNDPLIQSVFTILEQIIRVMPTEVDKPLGFHTKGKKK